ncbi:hypothetical protein JFT81_04045 [Pseudomonas sp. TH43]|nr:hypothetical protein [Pseudomonas sp. TH43]
MVASSKFRECDRSNLEKAPIDTDHEHLRHTGQNLAHEHPGKTILRGAMGFLIPELFVESDVLERQLMRIQTIASCLAPQANDGLRPALTPFA